MLLGLLARLTFGGATAIGFLLFIIFTLMPGNHSESFFDRVPSWLKVFLVLCVICYGITEVVFMVKSAQHKPRREKPPNI